MREKLLTLAREVLGVLSDGRPIDWAALSDELAGLSDETLALSGEDPGHLVSAVTVVNLLTDCVSWKLEVPKVVSMVEDMLESGWRAPEELVRHGPDIEIEDDSAVCCSAMTWSDYRRYILEGTGIPFAATESTEAHWKELQDSRISLDAAEVVHLADPAGLSSSWVADERQVEELLKATPGADRVYDELGLDWSGKAEDTYLDGVGKTRAVWIASSLGVRGRIFAPTAADGWDQALFVPGRLTGAPWPDHGSATYPPTRNTPGLAEGVHGPCEAEGRQVEIRALGEVSVADYGEATARAVLNRAIERLASEVLSGSSDP